MNLWLIPAADNASLANIPKTLSEPISPVIAQQAGLPPGGRAWGAKAGRNESNVPKFERMAEGDWCLFYTQQLQGGNQKYRWKAQIADKRRSSEVSSALWGTPDFELVYFLENVQEVRITPSELSAAFAEFRDRYFQQAPKGFTTIDPSVLSGIKENYRDVGAWLEKLNASSPAARTPPTSKKMFNKEALEECYNAVKRTRLQVEQEFLTRFVASLAAKPFLILTGNSGTGKTKLAELFVQWLCRDEPDAFALVPVGADWTDNRNVLGFVNHLRPTHVEEEDVPLYQTTKILDLLLEARNKEKPFFLILDEMNLSHVERYFADFLSAMESRSGELLLHREGRQLPRQPKGECDVPETLPLPKNVFVIGTVNVDETTYMFSPKVLDRANVMEFKVGENGMGDFLEQPAHELEEIKSAPSGYAQAFLELSRKAQAGQLPHFGGQEEVNEALLALYSVMEPAGMEFGYRSANEILRYLKVDFSLSAESATWDWKAPFDQQILQKILPKLHGSRRRLESLLISLISYCETGKPPEGTAVPSHLQKSPVERKEQPVFAGSRDKLCNMLDAVRRDQFVSFIH